MAPGRTLQARPDTRQFDPWADDIDGPSLLPDESPTPTHSAVPGADASAPTAAEAEMLRLVNQARAEGGAEARGARPLLWDAGAAQVARAHCHDMIRRGFFDHVNPDGAGPADRLREAGVPFTACGENLALHPSVPGAHAAFMDEPPNEQNHRGNILQPAFTHVGIGVVGGQDGMLFIAEEFLAR